MIHSYKEKTPMEAFSTDRKATRGVSKALIQDINLVERPQF